MPNELMELADIELSVAGYVSDLLSLLRAEDSFAFREPMARFHYIRLICASPAGLYTMAEMSSATAAYAPPMPDARAPDHASFPTTISCPAAGNTMPHNRNMT